MNTSAVYVGDVCYRDDDEGRMLVVHVSANRGWFVAVNLCDRGRDFNCSGDQGAKRGDLQSFVALILRARRHATPEEMAFAWGIYSPQSTEGFIAQDRCGACADRARMEPKS